MKPIIQIRKIIKTPGRIAAGFFLLSILISAGAFHLIIDDDMMKMLPESIQSRKTWDAVQNDFGNVDMMFITIGDSAGIIWTEKNIQSIQHLAIELEKLDEVDEVLSLAQIQKIESDDGYLEVGNLVSEDFVSEDVQSIRFYLEQNPAIKKQFFNVSYSYSNIIIKPVVHVNNARLVLAVKAVIDEIDPKLEIYFSGQPYLTGFVPELIRSDVQKLLRVGILVMILILLINLRSIAAVGMVLSVILLSLASMMGFMGWMTALTGSSVFYFTMINSSMPIILLTIANSDGVHVVAKFSREFRKSGDTVTAIKNTMSQLNFPIFLTSLTTGIAFLTLVTSPINPLIGYGFCLAFGIVWAWLLSTTLLPALICIKKWNINSRQFLQKSPIENGIEKLSLFITVHPRKLLVISSFIGIFSLYYMSQVKVDVDYKNFFKPGTEIRDGIDFMDQTMGGYMNMVIRIEDNIKSPAVLEKMGTLQTNLEMDPNITLSFSIANIVKRLHRAIMDDDPEYEIIPDSEEKVSNLFTLYSMSADPDDFESLVNSDFDTGIINFLLKSVSTEKAYEIVKSTEMYIGKLFSGTSNITITGVLVIIRDMAILLIRSSIINIGAAILLIFLLSWGFYKSKFWGVLSILPLTLAVTLNFGIMGVAGLKLSHVTAILSSIIIGVGVDFAIHYIAQFREQSRNLPPGSELTKRVLADVGYPIFLDAASNMAFGALMFSSFVPVQTIGALMFFAMLSCSFSTVFILGSISAMDLKSFRIILDKGKK